MLVTFPGLGAFLSVMLNAADILPVATAHHQTPLQTQFYQVDLNWAFAWSLPSQTGRRCRDDPFPDCALQATIGVTVGYTVAKVGLCP